MWDIQAQCLIKGFLFSHSSKQIFAYSFRFVVIYTVYLIEISLEKTHTHTQLGSCLLLVCRFFILGFFVVVCLISFFLMFLNHTVSTVITPADWILLVRPVLVEFFCIKIPLTPSESHRIRTKTEKGKVKGGIWPDEYFSNIS